MPAKFTGHGFAVEFSSGSCVYNHTATKGECPCSSRLTAAASSRQPRKLSPSARSNPPPRPIPKPPAPRRWRAQDPELHRALHRLHQGRRQLHVQVPLRPQVLLQGVQAGQVVWRGQRQGALRLRLSHPPRRQRAHRKGGTERRLPLPGEGLARRRRASLARCRRPRHASNTTPPRPWPPGLQITAEVKAAMTALPGDGKFLGSWGAAAPAGAPAAGAFASAGAGAGGFMSGFRN